MNGQQVISYTYILYLQVNVTLQAWDKGSPQKTAVSSVTLDIITYATLDSEEETIKLEINEGMPAGSGMLFVYEHDLSPLAW